MKNNRKEGFANSVIFLMASQIIIKLFGLLYSMYLINKNGFGDTGNAIYMGGFQVYILLLTISSIGVPNAVSMLVAQKMAVNDYRGANKIFKISFISFGTIGFIGTLILFFNAEDIANNFLLIPECEYSLIALSPSIFFTSISSVIRGYFNGVKQISKTANSQTIEQIFKSILTISFVEIICHYKKDTLLMASIANFATTCASFINFIYVFSNYIILRKTQKLEEIKYPKLRQESSKAILKKIFSVAIPITLSAIIGSLRKNIDSFTVVRILSPILGEDTAKLKYGILSSKIEMLVAMPLSFNMAFLTALIPEISSARARNDIESINRKLSFSLLVAMVISLPAVFGLSVYSNQILNLLFPNANSGGELLKISAFCIIFISLTQIIGGALHGIGKPQISTIAMIVGVILKFILNILLLPIPNLYEKGAIISNLLSNIITFFIVWEVLKKNIKIDFSLIKLCFKPFLASLLMIISSYNIYMFLTNYGISQNISTIIIIIFAVFVYAILLLFMNIFSKKELFLLPKGEKIYKILKKFKIYS